MMIADINIFVPHVQKHVEHVMKSPPYGLCQRRILFMNPRPSCPDYIKEAKCDKFKMIIPYAGKHVECVVMFQASQPSCPPDFIFEDSHFSVPLDELSILRNWNVHKHDGLLELITQLMRCFKMKHIRALENYYYIHEEYVSLVSNGIPEDDIEVFVPTKRHKHIHFLIRCDPEFRQVPLQAFRGWKSAANPLLLVTYSPNDMKNCRVKLFFSENLESTLALSPSLKLPGILPKMTLGQYVRSVENELTNKAITVSSAYELRKRCMSVFLSRLEDCVIEYDAYNFTKLTFMLEDKGYHILVEINIPMLYPEAAPMLTFRSLFHIYRGEPTSVVQNSVPFNPDWENERVYEEIMLYIKDNFEFFIEDSKPSQFA